MFIFLIIEKYGLQIIGLNPSVGGLRGTSQTCGSH